MSGGDSYIEVVAPASGSSKEEVEKALLFLKMLKCKVRVRGQLHRKSSYTSDSIENRFKALVDAIRASDSHIIWCMRGGYGSVDLLPLLDKLRGKFPPKIFVGLSDISCLHVFLNQKWSWPTIHGPTLKRLGNEDINRKELSFVKAIIKGEPTSFEYKLKAFNPAAEKVKEVRAKICGGNLSTLCSLSGSKWQLYGKRKILFLEDINERGYQVDRALKNLLNAGTFQACKAVILGDFVGGDELDGKNYVRTALKNFFMDSKIPVFTGLKSGHGEVQMPVAFNSPAIIKENFELSIKYPLL